MTIMVWLAFTPPSPSCIP